MRYAVGCELDYVVEEGEASFVFNVEAQRRPGQEVLSERLILPGAPERFTAPETGNRVLRLGAGPGPLTLRYEATVRLSPAILRPAAVREVPVPALPLEVRPNLLPSRYVESDRLASFAHRTFGALPPGHERVSAIRDWVHGHLDYVRGSSDAQTTAADTLLQRQGVCRDFAHLAIAFCRALGIPARFVSAYAWQLDPPDFHAVMEAWLEGPDGGTWFLFDPTKLAAPEGMVRIGTGRDAAEVAFCEPFGAVECGKPRVWIRALDDAEAAPPEAAVTHAAA